MKLASPKLDQYGFPIPADFDDDGSESPRKSSGGTARRVRFILRMAILAGLAVAVWQHFDLTRKFSERMAKYHARQAWRLCYQENKLPESLAAINRAVSWKPDDKDLLWFRAGLAYDLRDYETSLRDVEQIAALDLMSAEARRLRQTLYHKLGRHQEAAAAAGELLERGFIQRAQALNSRAYARALGNFELDEALVDIGRALESDPDEAAFIDTRGYVLFQQGKYREALDEFERAIAITEQHREDQQAAEFEQILQGKKARTHRIAMSLIDEDLAVMYHHRGEAHEKLGDQEQALRDIRLAEQLGFDRAAGIY